MSKNIENLKNVNIDGDDYNFTSNTIINFTFTSDVNRD